MMFPRRQETTTHEQKYSECVHVLSFEAHEPCVLHLLGENKRHTMLNVPGYLREFNLTIKV